jgi:hypothetical protein
MDFYTESNNRFFKLTNLLNEEEDKAEAIINEIIPALDKSIQETDIPINTSILKKIASNWKGKSQGRKFWLSPDVLKFPVSLIVDGSTKENARLGRSGNDIDELVINLNIFNKMKKDQALKKIELSIVHEVEHMSHLGADQGEAFPGEGVEEAIKYLINPFEMKAHAKQYAYWYSQEFPNQPFDVKNLIELGKDDSTLTNYFVAFANPEKQQKYSQYGDIKKANVEMINLVKQYLEKLITK